MATSATADHGPARTSGIEPDPARFAEIVGPLLRRDPVRNTLPLAITDAIGRGVYAERLLAWTAEAGEVTGCLVQTPPWNVVVTVTSAADVGPLAAVVPNSTVPPGFVGLSPWALAVAEAWCARHGRAYTAEVTRAERLFRCDRLVAAPPTIGTGRAASTTDVDLITRWWDEFCAEVGMRHTPNLRADIESRAAGGRLVVWEVDGAPVSFAGRSDVIHGHGRIGPVYTPPELRGNGYASHVTEYATQALLDRGAVPTLFTDLANPTSNSIYQKIGYRPVADAQEVTVTRH